MVVHLLHLVGENLKASFDIDLQHEWVIELDSSNERKFSRHLHIRIPNTAFLTNEHVGYAPTDTYVAASYARIALESRE